MKLTRDEYMTDHDVTWWGIPKTAERRCFRQAVLVAAGWAAGAAAGTAAGTAGGAPG